MSAGPEPDGESRLVCAGCGRALSSDAPEPYRCAATDTEPGVDHVLVRSIDLAGARLVVDEDAQPFVRYRELLHAWRTARRHGLEDRDFVAMVRELDQAVVGVDGRGFTRTPLVHSPELEQALGIRAPGGVWVKDETGNVGGTHKGRHLFGLALWFAVAERVGILSTAVAAPLAIASCGNAAVAAAILARAIGRRLDVFVPPDANPAVVARLTELGAQITFCPREEKGPAGDPCVHRFRAAVRAGSLPFTCQGDANGLAVEGGHTLGWELAEQAGQDGIDRLFVQVGGGALASGVVHGLREAVALGVLPRMPILHAVQTEFCHPLSQAWRGVAGELVPGSAGRPAPELADRASARTRDDLALALARARADRARYMRPRTDTRRSVASAILDDETYDWAVPTEAMLATGGWPVVVGEERLRAAHELGQRATGIDVSVSGAAGLAGALELGEAGELGREERLVVLFTGCGSSDPL